MRSSKSKFKTFGLNPAPIPWIWWGPGGFPDKTAEVAQRAGAQVVFESKRGYGQACLRGLAALEDPSIVVFLDADYSDYPEELTELCQPISNDVADIVIGSRVLGESAPGALLPQARFCLLYTSDAADE